MKGTIKWFNSQKGYGFISDETGNDVMIYHARQYDEIIGDPLYDHNRHVYRMKIKWNSRTEPVFNYGNNF